MTQDIRPPWYALVSNIVLRLQNVARKDVLNRAYAILTINVLVKANGNPVEMDGKPLFWTKPEVTVLEPARAEVVKILEELKTGS